MRKTVIQFMEIVQFVCKKSFAFKKVILFSCYLLGMTALLAPGEWARAEKILVEENALSATPVKKEPVVGRAAAQRYFIKGDHSLNSVNARLLSLHVGGYLRSKAYQWGDHSTYERAGVQTTGVTYKVGEWTQAMDLNLRIDYMQFEFEHSKPIKISFLPLLTFPDSATGFPLYFGIGAGPGIFLSQMEKESNLSLDYQLIFGVRWLDVWRQSGFFIESGIKDHVHLLSDGQFMSQFLTAGAVFRL